MSNQNLAVVRDAENFPADQPDLWERQKGESRQAFQAFSIYRDLQPKRSLRQVAQELGKSTSLIGRWSSHWFWGKRVDAWDGFQDDRKRQARIDVIEQMSTRHSQTVQSALTILSMPVREAMNRFKQDPAILEMMELEDVMKLAIVCARTIPGLVESERLTRGAPTDISEITHQGGDRPVKLKIDWSDDWRSD